MTETTAETRRYYGALDAAASLEDKLFFLDRLHPEVNVFLDFGCGSGSILKAIHDRRPEAICIGYDRNPQAITMATAQHPEGTYTLNVQDVYAKLRKERALGSKVCVILSSVVHEVLSEGMSFEWFWLMVESFRGDFVVIRDFAAPDKINLPAFSEGKIAIYLEDNNSPYLQPFNRANTNRDILEVLLKYQYVENAEAEKAETYLSLTVAQWFNHVSFGSKHSIEYFDHHVHPYHKACWKRDFDLDLHVPTHIKIILRRNP